MSWRGCSAAAHPAALPLPPARMRCSPRPSLPPCQPRPRRRLSGNRFRGELPDAWAAPGAFPRLQSLGVSQSALNSSLPASWGRDGAFPALKELMLNENNLRGALPLQWGAQGAFPSLERL